MKLNAEHPVTVQVLKLVPPPTGKDVKIRVSGEAVVNSLDGLGTTTFTLNAKPGERRLVEVFVNGRCIDVNYHVLGGEIEIRWTLGTPK